MSYSGDAAEQVVRLSLETGEVAVKLAGEGAKQLAILLYAILREQKKTKGKTRLTNMLRSGKELKVFAVKDSDLQLFCREAKKYAAPEAPAAAEQMTEQEVADLLDAMLSPLSPPPEQEGDLPIPERTAPEPEQDMDEFLAAVLGASPTREEGQTENPTEGRIEKSRQSEPTSKPKEPAAPGTSDPQERSRPSVRKELDAIKAEQREKAAKGKEQPKPTKGPKHKAPRKYKPKRLKER